MRHDSLVSPGGMVVMLNNSTRIRSNIFVC